MRKRISFVLLMLLTSVQALLAWDGSGTSSSPYLIRSASDWNQLATDVSAGNSYGGKFFRLTSDIDAGGRSVGAEGKPFSGTFDGDGHTLTYDRGSRSPEQFVFVDDYCAPFVLLEGATVRHLNVGGAVFSNRKFAAGIASMVDGDGTTTILDCHVSSALYGGDGVSGDATFGGLVGVVNGSCKAAPVIKDCSFTGFFTLSSFLSGGMVGFAHRPVVFDHCFFDPKEFFNAQGCATFVRMPSGVESTFEECYYTSPMGVQQGKCVFSEVMVPDGCKAEFVSEPKIKLNGKKYYTSGAKVRLTVSEGRRFDHWVSEGSPGCFINDPWTANGVHTLSDVRSKPILGIATSMPEPLMSHRERAGINYRYLSRRDYLLFMSDSLRQARGYEFDKDGYCFVYDSHGTRNWITVVWNCDANNSYFQNYYRDGWFWSYKNYEGCLIYNDLVSDSWEHTHLFAIAPRAFLNVPNLKRIVFVSDISPTFAMDKHADLPLDVQIQEQAFKDSGIEELVMMYKNEKTGSWDVLGPKTSVTISADAFEGTGSRISVDPGVYQGFLGDQKWSAHHNRFGIYAAKVQDIKQDGAIYSYWRDFAGEPLKNDANGHSTLMNTLKTWNAGYMNFNAAELLAEQDKENVWYAQIIGVDDSSLDHGKMTIRNDPGTTYNYKTLNIAPNAFAGNKNLQYIEFEQVVGGRNSYSDMKMVIQNGAFKGCTNLKELRLFYHVNGGSDPYWTSLGPQDVIPGDNIFGLDRTEDVLSDNLHYYSIPNDFRILVAPERMAEFMHDPNWAPYTMYIKASDLTPTTSDDEFEISGSKGLTYAYISNLGGILQTSQTVSQDLSWWTLPRIVVELAMHIYTIGLSMAANPNVAVAAQSYVYNSAAEKSANTLLAASQPVFNEVTVEANGEIYYGFIMNHGVSFFQDNLSEHFLQAIPAISDGLKEDGLNKLLELGFLEKFGTTYKFVKAATFMSTISKENLYKGMVVIRDAVQESLDMYSAKVLLNEGAFNEFAVYNSTVNIMRVASGLTLVSGIVSPYVWNAGCKSDALKKGMRDNIISNMHQLSFHAGSYIIFSPTKNLVYHTYVKRVYDNTEDAVIYAGTDKKQGRNASSVTMTFASDAFQNHKNLKTVSFHENNISTHEGMPMLLTIPDSAFYGCDNLVEFSTIIKSENGSQVLGPESFILAGDSVFVGLDPKKFHILIDESRKEDYLASESWAPLERYFRYTNTLPDREHDEYGGWYAFAYENGSLQKVHKVEGHKIEHMIVTEPDDKFLVEHQGGLKLCNDIGSFNNYQLDAVRYKAFYGNPNLRVVNFTDLKGTTGFGDTYTDLDVTLQDSCFANCPNLANIDMLYLVTDGKNRIDPITPQQVKLGRGVLSGTTASIKMMPRQVEWFQKDTTWAKYSDRFLPCVIKVADDEVNDILEDMAYIDFAHTGYDDVLWTDYIDLARIGGAGFSWLDGKFRGNGDIHSFNEFRHFACVGLDYVGSSWFRDCTSLSSISLPPTVTKIYGDAFNGCTSLTSIEIPEKVSQILGGAFAGCTSLNTIRVRGRVPAGFNGGTDIFAKNEGLKIYVPDGTVDAYKKAWAEYKDYIVSDKTYNDRRRVVVTAPGQLAQKLGLTVEKERGKVRHLRGEYASIDSLTVTGPLNGEDLGVIRHLAGADAYDSDPTDGCLVYLNLWNADLRKDDDNSYNGNGSDEYIDADNKVPDYLFENCTSIETVVFPKSATRIGENIFEDATSLRKVCVGLATTSYECDILQSLPGIEELVLLTDGHATSDYRDPWEAYIGAAYTTNAQVGNYLGDANLIRRTSCLVAPFKDDAVMRTLADHGQFFPSDYMKLENIDGIFSGSSTITDFSDFYKFGEVRVLNKTFSHATALRTVTLPDSVTAIGADAFVGCTSLDTIYVSCDSVPSLAAGAFKSLPSSFRIFVPKRLCKLYRTKWSEYADHINVDESLYDQSDIVTVTVTEPNTLAEKLGLRTHLASNSAGNTFINNLSGDYSQIRKLKVVGPISGADFDVIRHMAGWCTCINKRNLAGHLEYLDLYDADVRTSGIGLIGQTSGMGGFNPFVYNVEKDDVMPYHALLKAYTLKTLILPKSCKKVDARALQECEGLEVIVVGDDMEEFNWNALDDDASLTRMYFLSKKKVEMTAQNALWRALCNNYNPTFDAFYVRPSQLELYRSDPSYTGSSWQRTNNIQCGIFKDDEQFLPFAAHAAVTYDDLATVTDVNGWFSAHKDIKDLSALAYTSVRSLRHSDLHELTKLEKIELPPSFEAFYDNTVRHDEQGAVIPDTLDHRPFAYSPNLRYVNMLYCDSAMVIDDLRGNIKDKLGICGNALVYVPGSYGTTDEHNVVWGGFGNLQNNYLDLCDTLDYLVPMEFTSRHVSSTRVLKPKKSAGGAAMAESKYTVCLPYDMPAPSGAKAFKLEARSGSTLVFTEEQGTMSACTPYLLVLSNSEVPLGSDIEQVIPTTSEADAKVLGRQLDAAGYSMRGTLKHIGNGTAHELGSYILQSDNKWHAVPAGVEAASIPAFRAYLLQNGNGAYGINAFDMQLNEGGADGVDTILTIDRDGNGNYYDLSGRKLDGRPQRGVYIHQGKKHVNKQRP